MSSQFLLINGPNINTLGSREPGIYGHVSLKKIEAELDSFFTLHKCKLIVFQSNHEGAIIDFLQLHKAVDGIIINPAGLTHTSINLRDALLANGAPFIEVHISNIYKRESFRHFSYLSDVASGVIIGLGDLGYHLAASAILKLSAKKS